MNEYIYIYTYKNININIHTYRRLSNGVRDDECAWTRERDSACARIG